MGHQALGCRRRRFHHQSLSVALVRLAFVDQLVAEPEDPVSVGQGRPAGFGEGEAAALSDEECGRDYAPAPRSGPLTVWTATPRAFGSPGDAAFLSRAQK